MMTLSLLKLRFHTPPAFAFFKITELKIPSLFSKHLHF
jgi:hypothetical protein